MGNIHHNVTSIVLRQSVTENIFPSDNENISDKDEIMDLFKEDGNGYDNGNNYNNNQQQQMNSNYNINTNNVVPSFVYQKQPPSNNVFELRQEYQQYRQPMLNGNNGINNKNNTVTNDSMWNF